MRIGIWFLLLMIWSVYPVMAQTEAPPTDDISGALSHMKSTDIKTRELGFEELVNVMSDNKNHDQEEPGLGTLLTVFFAKHPNQVEEVKTGLINLLGSENALFMNHETLPGTFSEKDTEYYAEIIDLVSTMNDERSIPVLAGAISIGGMATRGLVKYGSRALQSVLDQMHNSDPTVRSSALITAVTILERENDPSANARVSSLVGSALDDNAFVVRSGAVSAIETLRNRDEYVPILERLAENDPARLPLKSDDGGDLYPVRLKAKRLLLKIGQEKSSKH